MRERPGPPAVYVSQIHIKQEKLGLSHLTSAALVAPAALYVDLCESRAFFFHTRFLHLHPQRPEYTQMDPWAGLEPGPTCF